MRKPSKHKQIKVPLRAKARLIEAVLSSPQFKEAWECTNGFGLGSVSNGRQMWKLIRKSEFHLGFLNGVAKKLLTIAAKLADQNFTDEAIEDHFVQIHEEINAVAVAYTITGVLVGLTMAGIAKNNPVDLPESINPEASAQLPNKKPSGGPEGGKV